MVWSCFSIILYFSLWLIDLNQFGYITIINFNNIKYSMVEARQELNAAKAETKQFRDDVKLWKRA